MDSEIVEELTKLALITIFAVSFPKGIGGTVKLRRPSLLGFPATYAAPAAFPPSIGVTVVDAFISPFQ